MARVSVGKLRREAIPLLFFGTVVSVKVYFLIEMLFLKGGLDQILHLARSAEDLGPAATYTVVGLVTYVFYNLTAILFDGLVVYSYLIRHEPVARAQGFWERVYPLATVLIPVTGFTLLAIPAVRAAVPAFDFRAMALEHGLSPVFFVSLNIAALATGVVGAALSFVALWSLRRSFSLMSEVRELVTGGLYRRIRHPLYMAEIIHLFGIAILSGTPVGLWLYAVAVAMQVGRAKIEERKFLATVPQYAEFRARTGFLWPKLWQRRGAGALLGEKVGSDARA
jgi:protein-S-isoprenylcysteine O-methyltransferase Ste14